MYATHKDGHREASVLGSFLSARRGAWLKREESIMGTSIGVELWADDANGTD